MPRNFNYILNIAIFQSSPLASELILELFAFEGLFSVTQLEIYDIIMVTIKDSINLQKKT
jgi:hypothetical protein